MSIFEGLLIFLFIVILYLGLALFFKKKGVFDKYNISFWGPALMWRTTKGISFLKKLARVTKFWKIYGNIAVVFCFIAMILMTAVIIWQAWAVLGFTAEQREALPGIEVAFILPGINPILPLEFIGYIILGLIVGMIVHEFSHGILTLIASLKVKALGILYLIVPIGAFCEPDEESLHKAAIPARMRVYAAGPASNFLVVFICVMLFSFVCMGSVQTAGDGVGVFYVVEDSPAEVIGLQQGMIITELNGTVTTNVSVYQQVLLDTKANQTVSISFVQGTQQFNREVTLADRYAFTNNVSHAGQGFLGIGGSEIHTAFLMVLQNPFIDFPNGFLLIYIIPLWGYFQGYNPLVAPFNDAYVLTGPLSVLPPPFFWVIVNALYWIFWLNLALALFNVLPMVPLDGGFLFKDAMQGLIGRLRKELPNDQREKIIKKITVSLSLIVLVLVFFPWIVKYIFP